MIQQHPTERWRDTQPNTWAAWDRHGKRIAMGGDPDVPAPNDKIVGIFYWTWHGNRDERSTQGPFTVSSILELNPNALDQPDHPAWGKGNGCTHYWGEPMFGYYLNDDAYVIRKHCQMLVDAGVDFLAFDASNFTVERQNDEHPGYFRKSTKFLLDTYVAIRSEGKPTPQLTFIMPFFTTDPTCVQTAYDDFYRHAAYADLWFQLEGKPLMLFNNAGITNPTLLDFFTFRRNMPDYHLGPDGYDQWPWLENYPQHPFYASADPNQPEMLSVGVAQNSVLHPQGGWRLGSMSERDDQGRFIARGRSFHRGSQPQPGEALYLPEKGFNFREQWQRVGELNPRGVFITGWNEWIMGRWESFRHYSWEAGVFVDQFNEEFSRDIEPMRGGYLDDYYYMLVEHIRKFKGAPAPPVYSTVHTIDLDDFAAWEEVSANYYDDIGDNLGRLHDGAGIGTSYIVPQGQHDFVRARVAHDAASVFFYIETARPIAQYRSGFGAWMQLLIKVCEHDIPSWEGYQFTVNRKLLNNTTSVLEHSTEGWSWNALCHVPYRTCDNQMALRIPRKALGIDGIAFTLHFKWIDSMQPDRDILQLYTHGDTAPNGRFAYVYCAS